MKSFRLFQEAASLEQRKYTIETTPEMLERFERFLSHIQWCSGVGHSTGVVFSIDGDGPDRFKVLEPDVRPKHPGEDGVKHMRLIDGGATVERV